MILTNTTGMSHLKWNKNVDTLLHVVGYPMWITAIQLLECRIFYQERIEITTAYDDLWNVWKKTEITAD